MEIHIGERTAEVELVSKDGNKVEVMIDGKPFNVDIVTAENGSCSILHNGNSFNAEVLHDECGKGYDVNILSRSFHIDIVDTQAKYLRMKKGGDEAQGDKIEAPMPGKVVKVCVKAGDKLKAGDNVSTDDILPGGAAMLTLRSNIPATVPFIFKRIAPDFGANVASLPANWTVVGGANFGQGSSREQAVMAPMSVGMRIVVAKSMARIFRKNLINNGVIPLIFKDEADYDALKLEDSLLFEHLESGTRRRDSLNL